ncbi:hypothetical protein BKA61DRAFT_728985 [Leptodontidium sp. MPI-SDFR-AT-0119]|nr:hypothetical protein BKA61DRAFT_728985 [Leptodontidium sp. MPI-SDFR-AT-0119]
MSRAPTTRNMIIERRPKHTRAMQLPPRMRAMHPVILHRHEQRFRASIHLDARNGQFLLPVLIANSSSSSSRKRARNQNVASSHETTARQDAKILRDLAALDRENAKDVSIPVPIRHRDNAGRGRTTSVWKQARGTKAPAMKSYTQSFCRASVGELPLCFQASVVEFG